MDFATVNLGRVRALLNGRTVTNISASSPLVLTQVGTNLELSAPTVAAHLAASNPHGITTSSIGAATSSDLTSHTGNVNNPHGVTKAQVGLENVENKTSAQILAGLTNANIMNALDSSIRLWTESGPLNPLPLTRCRVNSYLNTLVVDIDPSQFITGTGTPAMAGESNGHMIFGKSEIGTAMVAALGSSGAEVDGDYLDYYGSAMNTHDGEYLYQIASPVANQQYTFVWYGKTYDDSHGETGLAFKYSDGTTKAILSVDDDTGFVTDGGGATISDAGKTVTGIVFKYNSDAGNPAMQMTGSGLFDYDIREDVDSQYGSGMMAQYKYALWVTSYSYENIHTMTPISKIVLQKLPALGSAPTESQSIVLDKDEKFAGGIVDIIRGALYVKYRVQEITSAIQFAFVGTVGDYSVFSYTPSSDTDPFGDMMYLSQDVYTAGTTTASDIGLASTHFPCSSVCSTYSASPGKMDVVAVPAGNNRNTIYIGVPSTVTTKSQLDTWLGGLSSPMKVRYPVMDWKIIPGRLIKCDSSGQCLKCTQPQSTLYAQYMIANE